MHEVSVAQNIIEIATDTLRKHNASLVRIIRISAGRLSGVDADALRFAMDIVKDGTPLSEASIDIEVPDAEGNCRNCGKNFTISDIYFVCPHCASPAVDIQSGDQLQIIDMEVE